MSREHRALLLTRLRFVDAPAPEIAAAILATAALTSNHRLRAKTFALVGATAP
ncbi:MAG: hypothetical protein IPK74_26765 [Deltaproteobacteria bacterium]|nr:hypothetical protein [Deltaproteobacteria bacterium]